MKGNYISGRERETLNIVKKSQTTVGRIVSARENLKHVRKAYRLQSAGKDDLSSLSARSPEVHSLSQRDFGKNGSVRGGGSHSLKLKLFEAKDDIKNKATSVAPSNKKPALINANEIDDVNENLMARIRMKIKAMSRFKEGNQRSTRGQNTKLYRPRDSVCYQRKTRYEQAIQVW